MPVPNRLHVSYTGCMCPLLYVQFQFQCKYFPNSPINEMSPVCDLNAILVF